MKPLVVEENGTSHFTVSCHTKAYFTDSNHTKASTRSSSPCVPPYHAILLIRPMECEWKYPKQLYFKLIISSLL